MPLFSMLYVIRVPLIVAVLSVLLLLVPPQARDMMDYLREHGRGSVTFDVSVLLLAGSSWYWARAFLNARFAVNFPRSGFVVGSNSFRPAFQVLWTSQTYADLAALDARLGSDSKIASRAFTWLPRCLFMLVIVGGLLASGSNSVGSDIVLLAALIIFIAIWLPTEADKQRPQLPVPDHVDHVTTARISRIFVLDLYTPPLSELLRYAPWRSRVVFWLASLIGLLPMILFLMEAYFIPLNSNDFATALSRGLPGPAMGVFLLATLLGLFSLIVALGSSWAIPLWRVVTDPLPSHFGGCLPIPFGPLLILWTFLSAKYLPLHDVRVLGPDSPRSIVPFVVAIIGAIALFGIGRRFSGLIRNGLYALAAVAFLVSPLLLNLSPAGGDSRDIAFEKRAYLADFLSAWIKQCAPQDGPVQPVIVALSGGASRAGLWAARALWSIDQQLLPLITDTGPKPAHPPAIFAISSVSGGSLGAAEYMALRRAAYDSSAVCNLFLPKLTGTTADAAWSGAIKRIMIDATKSDALGADIAGLYRDFFRSIVFSPASWLTGQSSASSEASSSPGLPSRLLLRDRAAALEVAFSQNWKNAPKVDRRSADLLRFPATRFDDDYLALNYRIQPKQTADSQLRLLPGMPIWIGNGTDLQNGTPVLTTPFKPDRDKLAMTWPFPAARDALALVQHDIRISTAITNTARFPLISPVGDMVAADTAKPGDKKYGRLPTQLGDGGYFDNSGLLTALELATWLTHLRAQPQFAKYDIEPIIVAVTADSDPVVTAAHVERCGSGPSRDPALPAGVRKEDQISEEALALDAVRSGHTQVLLFQIADRYCHTKASNGPDFSQPRFFHLYLHANGGAGVPMNWVISDPTAHFIWMDMDEQDNQEELFRLRRRALGLPDPSSEAAPEPPTTNPPQSDTVAAMPPSFRASAR